MEKMLDTHTDRQTDSMSRGEVALSTPLQRTETHTRPGTKNERPGGRSDDATAIGLIFLFPDDATAIGLIFLFPTSYCRNGAGSHGVSLIQCTDPCSYNTSRGRHGNHETNTAELSEGHFTVRGQCIGYFVSISSIGVEDHPCFITGPTKDSVSRSRRPNGRVRVMNESPNAGGAHDPR
jgi:hypothetical protein